MIGEPLVDDAWVAKAEGKLRQKYPKIPETAVFATYVQPKVWTTVNGVDRQLPDTAVFLIKLPNPRHPDFELMERGAEPLAVWKQRVKAFNHLPNSTDPLEAHFEAVARSLSTRHYNLRTMIS